MCVLRSYMNTNTGLPVQDGIFQKTLRPRRPGLPSCAGTVSRAAAQANEKGLAFPRAGHPLREAVGEGVGGVGASGSGLAVRGVCFAA